jgi:hypothetical protein
VSAKAASCRVAIFCMSAAGRGFEIGLRAVDVEGEERRSFPIRRFCSWKMPGWAMARALHNDVFAVLGGAQSLHLSGGITEREFGAEIRRFDSHAQRRSDQLPGRGAALCGKVGGQALHQRHEEGLQGQVSPHRIGRGGGGDDAATAVLSSRP